MTLATQMTTDLTTFFDTDEFAQTVVYNSASITAIVTFGDDMEPTSMEDQVTLCVKATDVTTPSYRDTVVIGTSTYYVEEIGKIGDGYTWLLKARRNTRPML